MAESAEPRHGIPLEGSIPAGAAPLESILCTEELHHRRSRPPDYQNENRALVKLVSALADSPATILQTLAETILDITQCDSAGLSLLTKDGKTPDVRDKEVLLAGYRGNVESARGRWDPAQFRPVRRCARSKTGPCCSDISNGATPICCRSFQQPKNACWSRLTSPARPAGTIWAIMHSDRRQFDAEDDRVMASLGKFASSAYQALTLIDDLKIRVSEREKAEAALRELSNMLETRVQVRTEELEQEIAERKGQKKSYGEARPT